MSVRKRWNSFGILLDFGCAGKYSDQYIYWTKVIGRRTVFEILCSHLTLLATIEVNCCVVDICILDSIPGC